jgi:hypothetical protein
MSEDALDNNQQSLDKVSLEDSEWFSTYGILTAQRILQSFYINLDKSELIAALNNKRSIYYQLLRVPLKHVYNGILKEHAHDYQVYAQKLQMDFYLSGQNDKPEDTPGADTREALLTLANQTMALGDEFNQFDLSFKKMIAASQHQLISLATRLQSAITSTSKQIKAVLVNEGNEINLAQIVIAMRQAIVDYQDESEQMITSTSFWAHFQHHLKISMSAEQLSSVQTIFKDFTTIRKSIDDVLSQYLIEANSMTESLKGYRASFRDTVIKSQELIQILPDYNLDVEQDQENLSHLNFKEDQF